MAVIVSLVFLLICLGVIVLTLGICRASSQADAMFRRIADAGADGQHNT